jgi:hypothetical protein
MQTRAPAVVPLEHDTVKVVVVSTAVPGRTLTFPKATAGMLTVHVCACAFIANKKIMATAQPNLLASK